MLNESDAATIVDRIDLRALPICPLCHLDLAFAISDGKPRRVLAPIVTRTASWVWCEIEVELRAQLRRESMRGHAWAREALADLDERGPRSGILRVLVARVATEMAEDMRRNPIVTRPVVLTIPTHANVYTSTNGDSRS